MSKTPQRRKRRNVNPRRKQEASSNRLLFGGLYISLFIATWIALNVLKTEIVDLYINYKTYELKESDYKYKVVHDVLTYNHRIAENPSLKDKIVPLLSDKVYWYNKMEAKEKVEFSSPYSKFYFAHKPIIDNDDDLNRNYDITFMAVHKLRNPNENQIIAIDNNLVKIRDGRLAEIKSTKEDASEIKKYRQINKLHKHYVYCSIIFSLLISTLVLSSKLKSVFESFRYIRSLLFPF